MYCTGQHACVFRVKGGRKGMRHDPEVKAEVEAMYKKGIPRQDISESTKIPLSTISCWTRHTVSEPLSFITCVVCGRQKRTLNIQQRYCSESCKNRANYHRRRDRGQTKRPEPEPQKCEQCHKEYIPTHGNVSKYCGEACRESAAKVRQWKGTKGAFDESLNRLLRANKEEFGINRDKYREDIEIVENYDRKNRISLSQVEQDQVQKIYRILSRSS